MNKTANPKKFIISCRIDDHERQMLDKIARSYGTNISELMRQSLILLAGETGGPPPSPHPAD